MIDKICGGDGLTLEIGDIVKITGNSLYEGYAIVDLIDFNDLKDENDRDNYNIYFTTLTEFGNNETGLIIGENDWLNEVVKLNNFEVFELFKHLNE